MPRIEEIHHFFLYFLTILLRTYVPLCGHHVFAAAFFGNRSGGSFKSRLLRPIESLHDAASSIVDRAVVLLVRDGRLGARGRRRGRMLKADAERRRHARIAARRERRLLIGHYFVDKLVLDCLVVHHDRR